MSEAEHQATDTLLPQASLYVFSEDKDTLLSTAEMQKDWRFARVNIQAEAGNVETAIELFKTQTSPDLLIIQTEDIDESFTGKLGELSEYCEEGTAAIIVGPVNDVYLYRELIQMGISDYLVKPIMPDVLKEVVAKALISQLGVSDSRLIAFTGSKGGVGTSSIAAISALILSEKLGNKTVLLDGAGGWSSLSVAMGFDPSATLHEVARAVELQNEDALERMFHQVSEKLTMVASGADAMLDPGVDAKLYEAVLDNLMVKYPVVMVDLSGADPALKKTVISRAHQTFVVTTPTVTALRSSRTLIKEVSEVRGGDADDVTLLVNMEGLSKANEVDAAAITEALDVKPALSIAHMPALFLKFESEIAKIFNEKDGASLISSLESILSKLISGKAAVSSEKNDQNSGILGGFLNKLSSK